MSGEWGEAFPRGPLAAQVYADQAADRSNKPALSAVYIGRERVTLLLGSIDQPCTSSTHRESAVTVTDVAHLKPHNVVKRPVVAGNAAG